jgi:maleylacetate reductase
MTSFTSLTYAQQIIFGPGTINQLGEAVDRFGWQRILICTSASQSRNGQLTTVAAGLGRRLAGVYDRVQPHVPQAQVQEALAQANEWGVDAVVGLGGGSPIGLAKAVAAALEEVRTGRPAWATQPTEQPLVPVIAIPTTYAGSEMTAVYGVTQTTQQGPRKMTTSDPKIAPKLVLYDPLLTLDLPPALTAATGINALAHCVEAIYSITRHPLSTVAALEGIRQIMANLPRCYANGKDVAARTALLLGAHLAGSALASVTMALHHGLCHVLGGSAGVPHGVANAIILPHAIRFNADVAAPWRQVAEAMEIATQGQSDQGLALAAAERIVALVTALDLPQHLHEAGVAEADLPRLAQLASASRTIQQNPKPVSTADLERLLQTAW